MGNEPLLAVTIRNEDAESHMSAKLVQGMPSLSLHLKKGDETVFVICDRCVK
jgi:hypothetical protein